MVTVAELRESAEEIAPGVIADRRYFHQHPELGFQEENTARRVIERLRALNLDELHTGIAKTGVVGMLHGGKGPGKTVLLRADMDALPITELNDVPYKSENPGAMHACGHDAHTAMLLGAARVLAGRRDEFAGTIKFLFQPSEEANAGRRAADDRGGGDGEPACGRRLRHPCRLQYPRREGRGARRAGQRGGGQRDRHDPGAGRARGAAADGD